ncbi:unnamed protein product [Candidula unifasciata]|uniref:Sodefrin-like factor n=1 Tax=Candidula unifasciata TaxID=100452 RepID=A0A8S3YVE2_9EUPU|nr:unnamed protein product [Candidula unifasciata]
MRTFSFLLCVGFLACLNVSSVRSLLCAQCNQNDPGCRSGTVLPTLCARGERFCFVFNVYGEGRQGTFRGCTNRDDTEGCRPITINNREHTGCLSVCSWEGCNSSQGEVLALLMKNR